MKYLLIIVLLLLLSIVYGYPSGSLYDGRHSHLMKCRTGWDIKYKVGECYGDTFKTKLQINVEAKTAQADLYFAFGTEYSFFACGIAIDKHKNPFLLVPTKHPAKADAWTAPGSGRTLLSGNVGTKYNRDARKDLTSRSNWEILARWKSGFAKSSGILTLTIVSDKKKRRTDVTIEYGRKRSVYYRDYFNLMDIGRPIYLWIGPDHWSAEKTWIHWIRPVNDPKFNICQPKVTKSPTIKPTTNPSTSPTSKPTSNPSNSPTAKPTLLPTSNPIQNEFDVELNKHITFNKAGPECEKKGKQLPTFENQAEYNKFLDVINKYKIVGNVVVGLIYDKKNHPNKDDRKNKKNFVYIDGTKNNFIPFVKDQPDGDKNDVSDENCGVFSNDMGDVGLYDWECNDGDLTEALICVPKKSGTPAQKVEKLDMFDNYNRALSKNNNEMMEKIENELSNENYGNNNTKVDTFLATLMYLLIGICILVCICYCFMLKDIKGNYSFAKIDDSCNDDDFIIESNN